MSGEEVEILLVEDNPDDAELTLRALKRKNLANRLHHVKDGAEALDFLFAQGSYSGRKPEDGPRLILLDLKLPKLDGLEVLKRLRADPRTSRIPVVILTSSSQDEDILRGYERGVNSYIVKPVSFDKFVDAVGQVGLYWVLLNQPPARGPRPA